MRGWENSVRCDYELANSELTRSLSSETADEWIYLLKSYVVRSEDNAWPGHSVIEIRLI